ncbi:RING-type E3 ubiquitin transferase [Melia azedarach]|uniref:RING-type E3 ubiquitin transferase n=1 Tax=Melia azedarach TaxID=155640 RepID=A0ACC1WZE2_MELAZ|nr:RING-type E3 ubiquitin transferase [Melia azedarach]
MAVSPQIFPPRKRRPSAGAFISPKLSDIKLVESLLELSQDISSLKYPQFLLKRKSLSIIRKVNLLSILFEELPGNQGFVLSPSTLLCLEEMYIVLQRIKTLIEDCSNGSKMWLLMQIEMVSNNFHELTTDLSTLLEVLPLKELDLSQDVEEVVLLIRRQCSPQNKTGVVDRKHDHLRLEVLTMLDRIKNEIVPDHSRLKEIFETLGLRDSPACREEIENLEEEIQNQINKKWKHLLVALIGLMRYTKCVLFGASTQKSDSRRRRKKSSAEVNVPSDFRCPISLELVRDPVVVATGQTYDRQSITLWIESGHNTCPKTGLTLAHTNLITNTALRNLISMWCREQKIPFEYAASNESLNGVEINKAALEATKMTASFLINKLSTSQSMEAANDVVYELRVLAKTDSDSRACIAEAGAIPLLVRYLGPDSGSRFPNLQVNAVTTILNLSILEANKTRIIDTDGALNGVIEVLRSGANWEAKGNAAATIFSLSGIHAHRKRIGRKIRVIKGLVDLAKEGPTSTKRDALVAILNLAADRETVGRLVEGGVVQIISEVIDALPEESVTILEAVVKRGGLAAIAAAYSSIEKLCHLLREGSDTTRESASATLVTICRKGGSEMVAEIAAMPGIERVIWELMESGTTRARRKAASLLRILRRWAAGLDSYTCRTSAVSVSSSRILLPS